MTSFQIIKQNFANYSVYRICLLSMTSFIYYSTFDVVTGNALHTQKDLARFLVEEKQADYCFTVKDNQPTLRQDIETLALNKGFFPNAETVESGH